MLVTRERRPGSAGILAGIDRKKAAETAALPGQRSGWYNSHSKERVLMLETSLKRATDCSNDTEEYEAKRAFFPALTMEHQAISLRIAAALLQYTQAGKLGRVLQAPCGVILSKETIRPDVLFVARERRGIIGKAALYAAPDLIVDLLCPRVQVNELRAKKKLYAYFEVKEYWIADADASTIEVLVWSELGYLPIGKYGKTDRLSSPLLPSLNLPLSKIFATEKD
jgi:Uma2 family endonuclease